MSEILYLLTLCLPLGTVLLVFGMRYYASIQQAKAHLAADEAYRVVAEKAAVAESATATALTSIEAALADIRTRMVAVEKILKDVE
jgi:hypothetical protein